MTTSRPLKSAGVTLVELLIGLAVGLIVLLSITAVFVMTVRASSTTVSAVRLNQEARALMLIMSNDLRRAGYWNQIAQPLETFDDNDNETGLLLRTQDPADTTAPRRSCALIAYDADDDGRVDLAEDSDGDPAVERYGYRLAGNAVQMRRVKSGNNDCAVPDNDNAWTTVLGGPGNDLTVEALWFTPLAAYDPIDNDNSVINDFLCQNRTTGGDWTTCALVLSSASTGDDIRQARRILIELTASLNNDRITFREAVRVRNDRTFNAP